MIRVPALLLSSLFFLTACAANVSTARLAPSEVPPAALMAQVVDLGAAEGDENQNDCIGIDDPKQVALGRQVYEMHCAACHGPNGEGQFGSVLATDEQGRLGAPPHDDTGHTWHHNDEVLLRVIREGGMTGETMFAQPMPAFGDVLSDAESAAVIAYIKTFWSARSLEIQCSRG